MEVVREPLMILDCSFIVKKANRTFYRTFGYLEEDVEESQSMTWGSGAGGLHPSEYCLKRSSSTIGPMTKLK